MQLDEKSLDYSVMLVRLFIPLALFAALLGWPGIAAEPVIAVVNATGFDIRDTAIRRVGTDVWKPVSLAVGSGQRGSLRTNEPDCAYDIRATLAGGQQVVFSRVNLCGVKLLTLQKRGETVWVDYD